MNLFGNRINLDLSSFPEPFCLQERLTAQLVKRDSERTCFNAFLSGKLPSGLTIFEDMQKEAEESASDQACTEDKTTLADFVTQELKARRNGVCSAYDHLVFDSMQALDPRARKVQLALHSGKLVAQDVPSFYPGLRNKTEGLLKAKIRESLGERESRLFAVRETLFHSLREMSQRMFYGINKLNLDGENLQRYLRVLYCMSRLEVATPERVDVFKRMLGDAIDKGAPLNLISIKCLRFTYPYGNRLKLLTTMGTERVPNKDGGVHSPLNEENYFDYLYGFVGTLRQEGIAVNVTVLVADLDLGDYFPDGRGHFVPDEDIQSAREDVLTYFDSVRAASCGKARVVLMSELLREQGFLEKYLCVRSGVARDLLQNKRNYLPENIVETRVNYRYDSNVRIFGIKDRPFARQRVCAQLASLFALQVLATGMTFLLAEDKSLENKLIGGKGKEGLPVVFVKLRDEA